MYSQLAHRHISTLAYDLKSKISLPCGYGFEVSDSYFPDFGAVSYTHLTLPTKA